MKKTKTLDTLDEAFAGVSTQMLEMFLRKHKDYGKGNILANGELGIAMRVSEKVERAKHLMMSNQAPVNESLEETWIDIGVYAIIAVLYRRKQFQELEVAPEA
ncbi:MAG: nucleotide modification associated domain-containing protein [bacterium]|nr:nucleotide modification associated domain-containing protein [bacterium]